MLRKLHKTRFEETSMFSRIMLLSAWGFVLAIASLLFLWVGYLLDQWLGTSPKMMLGLFFLAIVGCFIELIDEVWHMMKN